MNFYPTLLSECEMRTFAFKYISVFTLAAAFAQITGCGSSGSASKENEWVKIEAGDAWYALNTFTGFYIIDRDDSEVTKKVPIQFTKEEQQRVVQIADSVDFWSLRDSDFIAKYTTIKPSENSNITPSAHPNFVHLKTSGKENYIIEPTDGRFPEPDNADHIIDAHRRFMKVWQTIMNILEEKQEYRAAPRGVLRM